ncbi:MAG TPA: hypothetical protein VFR97_11010 [Capillimicrobium sp.]|nr:hypothetical protein [Capillimicrobium sp.]
MRFSSRPPRRRSPYRRSTFGLGPRPPFAYRRPPQRSGFRMFGLFPSYSTRTRGGGRVQVGGCCLPIPLLATLAGGAATVHALKRLR